MIRALGHIKDVIQGKAPIRTVRHKNWRKIRNSYKKIFPKCQCCGTKNKIEIHHVIPFHVDPSRELMESNLISLCKTCHLFLGHLKYYRSWNPEIWYDLYIWKNKIKDRPNDADS